MWLAGLDPQEGVYVPAWFHKGSLLPPPSSVPLVLVGPGTGCALFCGYVEQRAIRDVSGSAAPIVMFFGCRYEENDSVQRFLVVSCTKWGTAFHRKGWRVLCSLLNRSTTNVYVQHKMQEQSQRVWEGASIYVVGSSTKIPSDVMSALKEIISNEARKLLFCSSGDWKRMVDTMLKHGL